MTTKIYFSYDNDLQGEELEAFNEILATYFIQHHRINHRESQELIIGLIRCIDDCGDFCKAIAIYNPIIIGAYKVDGLPLGVENVLISEATEEEDAVYELQGTATYTFNDVKYLDLMPDEHTYDAEGNILTTTRPTVCKPLAGFAGWTTEVLA
jgi:hypothetical protein